MLNDTQLATILWRPIATASTTNAANFRYFRPSASIGATLAAESTNLLLTCKSLFPFCLTNLSSHKYE